MKNLNPNNAIKIGLVACVFLGASVAHAKPAFNHGGLKSGATLEMCYREPCTVAKVISFKQLSKNSNSSMLELTLLYGEKPANKTVRWNKQTNKIYVTCSYRHPTITYEEQVTILPLNPSLGVPGVLMNDAELYLWACHNSKDTDTVAARKFGYDVQE